MNKYNVGDILYYINDGKVYKEKVREVIGCMVAWVYKFNSSEIEEENVFRTSKELIDNITEQCLKL